MKKNTIEHLFFELNSLFYDGHTKSCCVRIIICLILIGPLNVLTVNLWSWNFLRGSLSSRKIMCSWVIERYRRAYSFNRVSLIRIVYRKRWFIAVFKFDITQPYEYYIVLINRIFFTLSSSVILYRNYFLARKYKPHWPKLNINQYLIII